MLSNIFHSLLIMLNGATIKNISPITLKIAEIIINIVLFIHLVPYYI